MADDEAAAAEAPPEEAPPPEEPPAEEPPAEQPPAENPPTEAATEAESPAAETGEEKAVGFQTQPGEDNAEKPATEGEPVEISKSRVEGEKVEDDKGEDADMEDRQTLPKSQASMSSFRQSYIERRKSMDKKKMHAMGSIISIRKGTQDGFDRGKIPRFMNSYKLDSDNPFNSEKVQKILEEVLTEVMGELTYEPDKVAKRVKWAAGAIRGKVKNLEFERYKLVCIVTVGEKKCQDVLTMVRFLWDLDRDRFAQYIYETMDLYGFALCFGTYYE